MVQMPSKTTIDPAEIYTSRADSYRRFISLVRYPQGLRAHFMASRVLRPGLRILDAGGGAGAVTLARREALL